MGRKGFFICAKCIKIFLLKLLTIDEVCGKIYLGGLGDVCACRLSPINEKTKIKRKEKNKMKNRKIVVIAFLVVASLLLGIGYAALTDTLTITGDLKADTSVSQPEFDADIYFSSTSVVLDNTGNQAASQILEGRDDAKITAQHFTTAGQKVKVKFTINNDSTEFAARLTPSALDLANGHEGTENEHDVIFNVVWSWDENSADQSVFDLQPGASKDLWVTIELMVTPTEAHTANFSVAFNAEEMAPTSTPVEP